MASVSADAKVQKPSFAKVSIFKHMSLISWSKTNILQIAAAGLKPPSAQQNSGNAENAQKHGITSSPQTGTNFVSPSDDSNPSTFTPKQNKLVPLLPKDSKEMGSVSMNGPEVHVQSVSTASAPDGKAPRALDGLVNPMIADEGTTQDSSSSGSGKPPSLDGNKSVASGTTFALDEKESLRPDDSASVKATDDEDAFSPPGSGLPGSRTGSDDGVRAFRDQLREISCMEPSRQAGPPQNYAPGNNPPQGVLYIPPHGPGVGIVPGPARVATDSNQSGDLPPDAKLLEALESPKDRIMVLKLEQDIVDFVKDARESSLKLPQTNAFYRMLAHKLADYYMLGHIVDESTMAVRIFKTPNCRLPPPLTGIATPSTAASTPPPAGAQMKILRRGVDNSGPAIVNGSNMTSKTASENGESGNDDDKRPKAPATREEREARYEAARKRIMGSARPSESPEEPVEMDNSRSSSAVAKKGRRKQRADSDDDFEARSAYYPTPLASNGATPTSYGFPNIIDAQSQQYQPPTFSNRDTMANYHQYGVPANHVWPNETFNPNHSTSNWTQNPTSGYDLPSEFQRTMAFQSPPMAMHPSNMQPPFSAHYQQQFVGTTRAYPQQSSYMHGYPQPAGPSYQQGYPNRSPSSSSAYQESQDYQFGQLPSQTFPGRPPSKLEHPLPGSYKGKYFNPQSQSFVPGQNNGTNFPTFTPQAPAGSHVAYGGTYGASSPLQWQTPAPAQHSAVSPIAPGSTPARTPNQPMTHPLPQPVFARQPSPNVPLPAKPEATPPKSTENNNNGPSNVTSTPTTQGQSSIAKWGTPASLPAKPPPSAEPWPPSGSARTQSGMPSVGSMPPPSGGLGISGQSMQPPRRA